MHDEYINILWHLIYIFSFIAIFIPIFCFTSYYSRKQRNKKKISIKIKYEKIIFEYLIDKKKKIEFLHKKFKRNSHKLVILEIIDDLLKNIKGEDVKRINDIIISTKLEEFVIRKLKSRFNYNKQRYLQLLLNLKCRNLPTDLLNKLKKNKSKEIRIYSIILLIKHGKSSLTKEFFEYNHFLSLWEHMNIYYYLKSININSNELNKLLYSKNDSVIILALRLMRLLNSKIQSYDFVNELLIKTDPQLQTELLRLLAKHKFKDINILIPKLNLYRWEDVLTNFSKLEYANTDIMMEYYKLSENNEIKKHILICIYNNIQGGKNDIIHFANQTQNIELKELSQNIIKHKTIQ